MAIRVLTVWFAGIVFALGTTEAAVELKGGIFLQGNTLEVRIKAFNDRFSSEITAVLFAVKYPSSSAVVFSDPVTPTPLALALQTVQSSTGFTYRFYSWVGADYKPDWPVNSEHVILRLTVTGFAARDSFMLVNDEGLVNANDPNFYIETPSLGGWFSGLYHSSTAAPMYASSLPGSIEIGALYPNPFAQTAVLAIVLQSPSTISMTVFDAFGRKVSYPELEKRFNAGRTSVLISAEALPAGAYYLRINRDGAIHTRRFKVIR